MPIAPIPELRTAESPPLYRDVRVVRWVGQIAVVAFTLAVVAYLFNNLTTNFANSGLSTSFTFLQGKFGSQIPGIADSADLTVAQAFRAGYGNTVRVILVGIPGATILGTLIGIARLSDNLAVRAFGTIYVETFRNIPALVWIYLAHYAISLPLIPTIDRGVAGGGFVLSNRGIGMPWLNPDSNTGLFLGFVGIALLATALVVAWRGKVNAKTGQRSRGGLFGIIAFVVVMIAGNFASGNPLALDPSEIVNNRNITGGQTIQIQYFSLTIALTLYTASHIAEVVRGAIQAIHKGQSEAANAIALTTFQRYRFIILPQALRIMIPPLANQYLNITKNSSLAVAVGYIEIAAVFGRVVNNATPAVQGVVILMVLYLTFSLGISLIANTINRRLSLETR